MTSSPMISMQLKLAAHLFEVGSLTPASPAGSSPPGNSQRSASLLSLDPDGIESLFDSSTKTPSTDIGPIKHSPDETSATRGSRRSRSPSPLPEGEQEAINGSQHLEGSAIARPSAPRSHRGIGVGLSLDNIVDGGDEDDGCNASNGVSGVKTSHDDEACSLETSTAAVKGSDMGDHLNQGVPSTLSVHPFPHFARPAASTHDQNENRNRASDMFERMNQRTTRFASLRSRFLYRSPSRVSKARVFSVPRMRRRINVVPATPWLNQDGLAYPSPDGGFDV